MILPGRARAVAIMQSSEAPCARLSFDRAEWLELGALYLVIAVLHLVGWGTFLLYSSRYPALVGLGFAAYMLGLRHAFDVDHIAAVDDTVRYMLQRRKNPLGVGFFFSLGHSTIVMGLAIALVIATVTVKAQLPVLREAGAIIGAGASAAFLLFVGVLNLRVLLDMVKVMRLAKSGSHNHAHLDAVLAQRGFLYRLLGARLQSCINRSWQMYPIGMLFGLGFDTASEIALLAMTAGRRRRRSPGCCGGLAADPLRGRHDGDGYDGRRSDVQGVSLGIRESAAQDLLQPHDDEPVDRDRAFDRLR